MHEIYWQQNKKGRKVIVRERRATKTSQSVANERGRLESISVKACSSNFVDFFLKFLFIFIIVVIAVIACSSCVAAKMRGEGFTDSMRSLQFMISSTLISQVCSAMHMMSQVHRTSLR